MPSFGAYPPSSNKLHRFFAFASTGQLSEGGVEGGSDVEDGQVDDDVQMATSAPRRALASSELPLAATEWPESDDDSV